MTSAVFRRRHQCDVDEVRNKISECLKQFTDLCDTFKVLSSQASMLGRSLCSLNDFIEPEVVGSDRTNNKYPRKYPHLAESLDDFAKIMISVSDKIKKDALEVFDNFIIQVIVPNDDEIKGIEEHNSQIVVKFHESFYNIFNHFLVLAAEILEKFLLCADCSAPIGFSHQSHCYKLSLPTSIWRKTKYDDKFITFGMRFSFYDIFSCEYRQNILQSITSSIYWKLEQQNHEQKKLRHCRRESEACMSKTWPSYWLRGRRDEKIRDEKKQKIIRFHSILPQATTSTFNCASSSTLFERSAWTPIHDDSELIKLTNFEITTFVPQQDQQQHEQMEKMQKLLENLILNGNEN